MAENEQKIGQTLPDGRVYAGVSPKTGKPMYFNTAIGGVVLPGLTWEETQAAMKNLAPHGWRLPNKDEVMAWMKRDAAEREADPRYQNLSVFFTRANSPEQPDSKEFLSPARRQPPKPGRPS